MSNPPATSPPYENRACFPVNNGQSNTAGGAPTAPRTTTTEAAVSEALLTLSSTAAAAVAAGPAPPQVQQQESQMDVNTPGVPSAFAVTPSSTHYQAQPQVTAAPTAANYAPPPSAAANHWQQQLVAGHQHAAVSAPGSVFLETPKHPARRVSVSSHSSTDVMVSAAAPVTHTTTAAALYHPHPMMYAEDAQAAKKARTVSPLPANNNINAAQAAAAAPAMAAGRSVSPAQQQQNVAASDYNCVSCICPICNRQIKGLGEHKVDWSQPVQGRQRAKTITSIKKHVKDFHEHEPIWNVIVNSLDIGTPTPGAMAWKYNPDDAKQQQQQQSRVVTAHAFVTQALKKAALDQIPNTQEQLRSFRWTEKMLDQRVGIAKGFIQFGGQEYLRNKECQDENGAKVNPKSLRNLAYCLLQSMYDELLQAWNRNQASIEHAMGIAPLGLLRNRFQLLFASPDKWQDSWYMDPSKYGLHHHHAGNHNYSSC